MYDIPFGDTFRLEGQWEVTQNGSNPNSCKLVISSGVYFIKKTWFKSTYTIFFFFFFFSFYFFPISSGLRRSILTDNVSSSSKQAKLKPGQ